MVTPAKHPRDAKRDSENIPPRIKAQITRLALAADSGELSCAELDKLKDEFYTIGDMLSQAIAAVNNAKEIADATETKVAARTAIDAAKAA